MQVVNEHVGDMLDAVSTGEDINDYCVEASYEFSLDFI